MTHELLLPALLTGTALLVVSGLGKLRDPRPAAEALTELGVPAGRSAAQLGAAAELVVACTIVVHPRLGAAAAAALFAGFALLVALQLRRGSARSCGCLGAADMPPSRAHVVVDLAFAGAFIACAVVAQHPLAVWRQPLTGAVLYVAAAASAWSIAAGLELLGTAFLSYRKPAS